MPTEFKLGLNILRTFKTQQNRHHFAIGEFIDNSVQSYMDNKEALNQIPGFKPTIKIFVKPFFNFSKTLSICLL